MKIVIAAVVIIGVLLFVGSRVLQSPHHVTASSVAKTVQQTTTKTTNTESSASPLNLYPKIAINCSTNVSLVQSTVDYVVTGMGCTAPKLAANAVFLRCNGTIFQHATNVSFDCHRQGHYASADQLQCSGTTNAAAGPTNLVLSYSCGLPSVAGNSNVYSCNGDISNYSSLAISLPMSVTCGA
jgi:hypothetical protein